MPVCLMALEIGVAHEQIDPMRMYNQIQAIKMRIAHALRSEGDHLSSGAKCNTKRLSRNAFSML